MKALRLVNSCTKIGRNWLIENKDAEIVDTLVSAIKQNNPQHRELLSEFIDAVANRSIPNDQQSPG